MTGSDATMGVSVDWVTGSNDETHISTSCTSVTDGDRTGAVLTDWDVHNCVTERVATADGWETVQSDLGTIVSKQALGAAV